MYPAEERTIRWLPVAIRILLLVRKIVMNARLFCVINGSWFGIVDIIITSRILEKQRVPMGAARWPFSRRPYYYSMLESDSSFS